MLRRQTATLSSSTSSAWRDDRPGGGGQLLFQPSPAAGPRGEPHAVKGGGNPLGGGMRCADGVGPGVLEEPADNIAVTVLRPAADDPAVPPQRRADVAGPVEQPGT